MVQFDLSVYPRTRKESREGVRLVSRNVEILEEFHYRHQRLTGI
jgi:hypothetical protein